MPRPWNELARGVLKGIENVTISKVGDLADRLAQQPAHVIDTAICALIGLADRPGAPHSYAQLADELDPDGKVGDFTRKTLELLQTNLAEHVS